LGQPDVFVANQRGEWIFPDNADPADLIKVVSACPSGALSYRQVDPVSEESPPPVNTVRVRENGPLCFNAELAIGETRQLRATICRCGASKNKPYCDGSHTAAGFAATGEPATGEPKEIDARDGELRISGIENGPLKVEGNLEIVGGSGRRVNTTTKSFMCRCGQSSNKPYCDGTHKRVGFEADAV
jgi:CDGSH-type Zn-finger protein